jgi:hypothetical protein
MAKQITVTVEKINGNAPSGGSFSKQLNTDRIESAETQGGKGKVTYWNAKANRYDVLTTTQTQAQIQTLCNAVDTPMNGQVTSGNQTNAAGATSSITITDANITTTSKIVASLDAYSGTIGTNGVPVLVKVIPGAGSATAIIVNVHASNALNGTVKINYQIN